MPERELYSFGEPGHPYRIPMVVDKNVPRGQVFALNPNGEHMTIVVGERDFQKLTAKPRESWFRRATTLTPWHFKTVAALPSVFMSVVTTGIAVTEGGFWFWFQAPIWIFLTTALLVARIKPEGDDRG